jgi:hypothetical protein
MSMNTLLIIGAVVGGIAAVIMRCKVEFLQPLCDAWPEGESPLDDIIAEFNKKPTALQNPKTSDYRSVTMDKEDPKVVSKRIQEQYNFKPGTPARKAADDYLAVTKKNTGTTSNKGYDCASPMCKQYPSICATCPKPKAKYASVQSLFTTARLAI